MIQELNTHLNFNIKKLLLNETSYTVCIKIYSVFLEKYLINDYPKNTFKCNISIINTKRRNVVKRILNLLTN